MTVRPAVAALLMIAAAGCGGGAIPRPTDQHVARAQARWPEATRASLERGRDLYVARCSGCHPLHRPDEYAAARWEPLVVEMGPRAKLSRSEQDLVLRYLTSVSPR